MFRFSWGWCLPLFVVVFLFLCVGTTLLSALVVRSLGATSFTGFTFQGPSSSPGSSAVASDFLQAMKDKNDYLQAYNSLDTSLLVLIMPNDFLRQATSADNCYGRITAFHQVERKRQGHSDEYIFSVMRGKLRAPYQFQLVLQQNANGAWTITSYGGGTSLTGTDLPACHVVSAS